jgi:phage tail-like protein
MLGFSGLFGAEGYPIAGFHFRVDFLFSFITPVDGRFSEVSGLSSGFTFEEDYHQMGTIGSPLKIPKGRQFGELVLKRGLTSNMSSLVMWYELCLLSMKIVAQPVIVTLLNEKQEPMYSWILINAYPIKMDVSTFDAMNKSGQPVIETFVLKYDYVQRLNAANPVSKFMMGLLF